MGGQVAQMTYLERPIRPRDTVEFLPPSEDGNSDQPILRDNTSGLSVEVAPEEISLWKSLERCETVGDALFEGLGLEQPLAPPRAARCLIRFGRMGWLGDEWRPPRKDRFAHSFGGLGPLKRNPAALGLSVAAIIVLAASAAPQFAQTLSSGKLEIMPRGGGALTLILGIILMGSANALARLAGILAAGLRVEDWGLRLLPGVPGLYTRYPDLSETGKVHRCCITLSGAVAPLAVVGLFHLLPGTLGAGALIQITSLGILGSFILFSPFLELDGARLYSSLTGVRDLRDKALAFLSRRFFKNLLKKNAYTRQENLLMIYGALAVLWVVAAFSLASAMLKDVVMEWFLQIAIESSTFVLVGFLLFFAVAAGTLCFAIFTFLTAPLGWLDRGMLRTLGLKIMVPACAVLGAAAGVLLPGDAVAVLLVLTGLAAGISLFRTGRQLRGGAIAGACFALVLSILAACLAKGLPLLQAQGFLPAFEGERLVVRSGRFLESMCLLGAGWAFLAQARTLQVKGRPMAIAGVYAVLAALLAGFRLWQVPDPVLDVAVATIAWIGIVGCAIGSIPFLLSSAGEAFQSMTRCFYVGMLLWTAVATLDAFAPGARGHPYLVGALTTWAFVMMIGASLAARLALSGTGWHSRVADRSPPVEEHSALVSAAEYYFQEHISTVAEQVGLRSAMAIEAAYNGRGTVGTRKRLLLEGGSLSPADWTSWPTAELGASLAEAAERLDWVLAEIFGKSFSLLLRQRALGGLYWMEWEIAQKYMLARLAASGKETVEDRTAELAQIPLFSQLPPSVTKDLARSMKVERYPAGARVVQQGEEGDIFYVVHQGELVVLHEDHLGTEHEVAKLIAGDCFGEMALLESGKRTAHVDALTEVELFSLTRSDFDELMQQTAQLNVPISAIIRFGGFLKRVPLFAALPAATISSMAGQLVEESFKEGDVIVARGDSVRRLYLVREGTVMVKAPNGTDLGEGGVEEVSYGAGQAFAEETLVGPERQDYEARASTGAKVLTLEKKDFDRYLERYLKSYGDLAELARSGAS